MEKLPKNKQEQEPPSSESVPEMSPEDLNEMLDQIPILKDMLQERENRLRQIENDPNADSRELGNLKQEIEELKEEIKGREELWTY